MKKILKFIRFQFLRCFNFMKFFWDTIFDLSDGDVFTLFGRYLVNMSLFALFLFLGSFLVIFMPIILCMFKYDAEVGF